MVADIQHDHAVDVAKHKHAEADKAHAQEAKASRRAAAIADHADAHPAKNRKEGHFTNAEDARRAHADHAQAR